MPRERRRDGRAARRRLLAAAAGAAMVLAAGAAPAGAAVLFKGSSAGNNGGGSATLTVARPAAAVAGDLMVATVTARTTAAVTPPAGWTLVRDTSAGALIRAITYTRAMGNADPASYDWALGATRKASGGIAAYRGVDRDDPVDSSAAQSGTGNPAATPPVTTSGPGRVVALATGFSAGGTLSAATATQRYLAASTGGVATTRTLSLGAEVAAPAGGTVAPRTVTHSVAGTSWAAHAVALRPAAPEPPNSPYATAVAATPGLLSWWRLDDPAPPPPLAQDSGPLLNTATSSGATYGRPTAIVADPGAAMALSGAATSFLATPDDAAYDLPTVTLEAWVRPAALSGSQTIVRKSSHWGLRLIGSTLNLVLIPASGPWVSLSSPAGAVVAGRWQHVVGTYDGAGLRLYIDGRPAGSLAAAPVLGTGALGVAIGRQSPSSTGEPLAGDLDEIAVYGQALAAAEVLAHYEAATPPTTKITDGPDGVTGPTVTFAFTSSQPLGGFLCRLDGGVRSPCSSPAAFGPLADGPHTFEVAAVDADGLVDPDPPSRAFTVVAPPVVPPPVPTPATPATPATRSPAVPAEAVRIAVLDADLRGPARARAGAAVAYRLVVRNTGTVAARGVRVREIVPGGLSLLSVPRGWTLRHAVLSRRLGTLAPGASRAVTLRAEIDRSAAGRRRLVVLVSATGVEAVRASVETLVLRQAGPAAPAVTG
jgi:uncharacterized repeat protein (TIGR01451 family)